MNFRKLFYLSGSHNYRNNISLGKKNQAVFSARISLKQHALKKKFTTKPKKELKKRPKEQTIFDFFDFAVKIIWLASRKNI
jgi:hypothetical protein